MALIMVITAVALITILMVAIFSLTQTEYKSTQSYVAGRAAKQLADGAVAIVEAQIQNGQFDPTTNKGQSASNRTFHVTQPGMVRVYNANGIFKEAYKLYSSSQMKVVGSSEAMLFTAAHQVPSDWKGQAARYVDLNEPVVRPGLQAGNMAIFFPIIDPRAAWNYLGSQTPSTDQPTTQVEGFSYSKTTPSGAGSPVSYNEVMTPSDVSDPSKLRLPMPVEWLYILQDGTTGTLNASNQFESSGSSSPSPDNPIVGRVAFWTDDESCKVNVNTAAEPTFMAPPYYYSDRDRKWAHYPASSGEYQRYPGHPATVALSSVLAPGYRMDPYFPSAGLSRSQILSVKDYIYDMVPKIAAGGSESGTRPFATDDFTSSETVAQILNTSSAMAERLYASVDEMLFQDATFNATTGRQPARYQIPGTGQTLFDHDVLERSRFFLTAHSRAPEFTMFGLPRVCMWPVDADDTSSNGKRTNLDNMIALCATLRGTAQSTSNTTSKSYIFRRSAAHNAYYDVTGSAAGYGSSAGLQRNSNLLNYLTEQMANLTWPRTDSSLGSSTNYSAKYGSDNVNQMAVQFFDYIRSTNLYDGVLARGNNGMAGNGQSGSARYTVRDNLRPNAKTYTDQRISPPATSLGAVDRTKSDDAGVMPGHGQVTPAIWSKSGKNYRGFGRMFTLSEVGLQIIATADGQTDGYAVNFGGQLSGGATAIRVDPTVDAEVDSSVLPWTSAYNGFTAPTGAPTTEARWYSNFPPITNPIHFTQGGLLYGCRIDPAHPELHPSRHVGYNPENWNLTLAPNTPLLPNQTRIQAVIMLEAFCPSLGWTKFFPEYTIVLDGNYINQIQIGGQRIFDTAGDIPVKSDGNLYEVTSMHSTGGHAGPTAIAGQRGGRPVSGGGVMLPSDRNYITNNTTGHNALTNYGLTSNFITVDKTKPLNISFPSGEFVIKIYDTHMWDQGNAQPVQIHRIRFSQAGTTQVPVPILVGSVPGSGRVEPKYKSTTDSQGRKIYTRSLQGPHFWCYNYEGCINLMSGRVNPQFGFDPQATFWLTNPTLVGIAAGDSRERQATRGRLDTATGAFAPGPGTAQAVPLVPDSVSDVIRTFVPTMGDYRIVAAMADVPSTYWQPHPSWNSSTSNVRSIHSFTNFYGDSVAGARLANDKNNTAITPPAMDAYQMVNGAKYNTTGNNTLINVGQGGYNQRQPDLPGDPLYAAAAQSFGDFDTGIGPSREGPYINKPDEGNFYSGNETRWGTTHYYRSAYFYDSWKNADDWRSGIYMTPNRMVNSPVMFGSLPTQVWSGGSSFGSNTPASTPYKPWQTLLFRPHSQYAGTANSKANHPGEYNPKDHFLLDMFFMPVVEPYAISEPLSVAGRINMNYQIMPFTNITRATSMHAVLKGEFMTAIPNEHAWKAKSFRRSAAGNWDEYWDETTNRIFWHRPIDVKETLRQFEERFNNNGSLNTLTRGLFRSASQICEIYMIPETRNGVGIYNVTKPLTNPNTRATQMDTFWKNNRVTGDNIRERPYANLYSRLTTRSNTFRVHMRAQLVKKARSSPPNTFDPNKDAIMGEYRGSTLIERYIDPNDSTDIPDYALGSNPLGQTPLESFYRFRVLESKRFSP